MDDTQDFSDLKTENSDVRVSDPGMAMNLVMMLMTVDKETRIDSRILARNMNLDHEVFIRTLRKYQNRLEKFGVFRFENGKPPAGSAGGRPEVYVMLNRNQAMFALNLARNTDEVVNFKFDLIEAFDIVIDQVKYGVRYKSGRVVSPAQESAMILQYVTHLWQRKGIAVTASYLNNYLKQFRLHTIKWHLNEMVKDGKLEVERTPHTIKYRPVPALQISQQSVM